MTREQIEAAFQNSLAADKSVQSYFAVKYLMCDFAIQQVNAALDEAAQLAFGSHIGAAIRALKIK